MYSSRQIKIISQCLGRDDYITYQEISDHLEISTRTIMREITYINDELRNSQLRIETKKGKGICLVGDEEKKQNLLIDIQGSKVDYMDKQERQELLCLELLQSKQIQKLYYYSNKFQVSEATISHDLDDVEQFLEKYEVELIRRPGFGIGVIANETSIRRAISSIINNTVQHHIMNIDFDRYSFQDVLQQLAATNNTNMQKVLDFDILKKILIVFRENRQAFKLDQMAKSSYIGLLIHLMIAVGRMQTFESLEKNREVIELVKDKEALMRAEMIFQCFASEFDIEVDEVECAFIAIHLESSKATMVDLENPIEEHYDVILRMLHIFKENGYNLFGDYELIQSLSAHLKPALLRLQYQLPIYNPLLKEIKENYKEIFKVCQKAGTIFEETYHYYLNDDEIGYLVLHFAAAIERYKLSNLRKITVGIVCSSGIGMSALLMARLKRVVDKNVRFIPLSISDVDKNDCELLISTFVVENAIQVTPLLNQSDVVEVLKVINTKRKQLPKVETKTVDFDLMDAVEFIKQVVTNLEVHMLQSDCDKSQMIDFVCAKMLDNPELVKVIQKREENGSTMYQNFHFGLLHATTDLVDHCLVKVFLPEKPFTNKALQDIDVILCMLLPTNACESHRQMMSTISVMLIEEPTFFETLLVGNKEEIQSVLQIHLQQYITTKIREE